MCEFDIQVLQRMMLYRNMCYFYYFANLKDMPLSAHDDIFSFAHPAAANIKAIIQSSLFGPLILGHPVCAYIYEERDTAGLRGSNTVSRITFSGAKGGGKHAQHLHIPTLNHTTYGKATFLFFLSSRTFPICLVFSSVCIQPRIAGFWNFLLCRHRIDTMYIFLYSWKYYTYIAILQKIT